MIPICTKGRRSLIDEAITYKNKAGAKQNPPPALEVVEVRGDGDADSRGDLSFSPLTGGNTPNEGDDTVDDKSKVTQETGDTAIRETNDEIIKQLDTDDFDDVGDLGLSDEEGRGYDIVQSFRESCWR